MAVFGGPNGTRLVSPANAIMSWAAAHERHRYAVVSTNDTAAAPVFGSNRPPRQPGYAGCCRAHGAAAFPGCRQDELDDASHVTFVADGAYLHHDARLRWSHESRLAVARDVYAAIADELASLPASEAARMRNACTAAFPGLAQRCRAISNCTSQADHRRKPMKQWRTRTATQAATGTAPASPTAASSTS